MPHWRNQSGRLAAGAHHQSSAYSANTRADSFRLPANSILTVSPPLEPSQFSDAMRNVVAAIFVGLFLSSVGIGLAVSVFILMFVET